MLRSVLALGATLGVMAVALAADSALDAAKSTMVATFKQESVPVDAPFLTFSGHINYDAANAAAASASIDVETASLDIGTAAARAEVRKPAWFDSGKYPMASFRSTAIKPLTATRFAATGTLTIKGKALTITVPIDVVPGTSGAAGSAFNGTLTISRQAYGIGDPQWNDEIDDQVGVRFHLVAHP